MFKIIFKLILCCLYLPFPISYSWHANGTLILTYIINNKSLLIIIYKIIKYLKYFTFFNTFNIELNLVHSFHFMEQKIRK